MIPYPDFSSASVLVIGDIILDRYFWGDVHRISPEAPVPVVRIDRKTMNLGGAGNVAMNLKGLGCRHILIGIAGDDVNGTDLKNLLQHANIQNRIVTIPNHPTTTKTRIFGQGQQVVRLDEEKQPLMSPHLLDTITLHFDQALSEAGAVIISDYGKGAVTSEVAAHVIAQCRTKKISVFIDPKGTSWERYRNAFCITPNTTEFNLIEPLPEENEALLRQKATAVMDRYAFKYLLLTRGPKGMTLFHRKQPPVDIQAKSREVFDVSGAGDTVIASLAAACSAGFTMEKAAEIANSAAGIVVGKRGTQPVEYWELKQLLGDVGRINAEKIAPLHRAVIKTAAWRHAGNKIVFTNGCFDILHVGHIKLLHAAAAEGDRLIVGLNSDLSVKRLKGDKRPVVPEAERAAILSSILGVDLVVLFDEETPLELIRAFQPDVLVKGGDYTPEAVVGHEIVTERGGSVVIVPLVDGISTTHVIESIQKG